MLRDELVRFVLCELVRPVGLGEFHLGAADRNEACGHLGRGRRIHDACVIGEESPAIHGIGLPRGAGAISEPRKSGPGQNGDVIRPAGVDYAQNSMWAANGEKAVDVVERELKVGRDLVPDAHASGNEPRQRTFGEGFPVRLADRRQAARACGKASCDSGNQKMWRLNRCLTVVPFR